jgi:hypothetical protein
MSGIHRRPPRYPLRSWLPPVLAWIGAVVAGVFLVHLLVQPAPHEPERRFTRLPSPAATERLAPR